MNLKEAAMRSTVSIEPVELVNVLGKVNTFLGGAAALAASFTEADAFLTYLKAAKKGK
jgi:hypothetical protein